MDPWVTIPFMYLVFPWAFLLTPKLSCSWYTQSDVLLLSVGIMAALAEVE